MRKASLSSATEKMQRGREARESAFDRFDDFGFRGIMFPTIFGVRDPFDDPFFSRPFGTCIFYSNSPHRESRHVGACRSKGPIIEELDSDGERSAEDNTVGDKEDKFKENTWANRNPLVEHPDDQTSDYPKSTSKSREVVSHRTDHNKAEGLRPQSQSASFLRVTYGGLNGAYYTTTTTTTTTTGSGGAILEESKQTHKTTGEATHWISRGIDDKGHSLTWKLDSEGTVDTMQTLHNLAEGGVQRDVTCWGSFGDPFTGRFGRGEMFGPGRNSRAESAGRRPKKVVTINIE